MATRIHITLPEDLLAWIKSISFHEGRTISNFIKVKMYGIQEEYDNESQGTKDSHRTVQPK